MNKSGFEILERICDEFKSLQNRLFYAEYHIKKNIEKFSPEELECLVFDGVIDCEEVPEHLRTELIEKRVRFKKKQKGENIAKQHPKRIRFSA